MIDDKEILSEMLLGLRNDHAKPTGKSLTYEQYRQRDLDRKNKRAELARDITIPECENPEQRAGLEANTEEWLRYYLNEKFTNPFSDDQKEIIKDTEAAIRHGYRQATAAPRGDGKTTTVEGVMIKAAFTGVLEFGLVICASGVLADQVLDNIKKEITTNPRLMADYPEICYPLSLIADCPALAKRQTANGKKTLCKWTKRFIMFPAIPGSPAGGTIFMSKGIDSSFRGLNVFGKRPRFVLADDPETRESAASDSQTYTRCVTLNKDIAGLAGSGKRLGISMLCTLQNNRCAAAKFTDPKLNPAWNGKRYCAIKAWPANKLLWEEYILMRKEAQESGDRTAAKATAFYVANREAMDEGAIVSNPHSIKEGDVSALQSHYNQIADAGLDNFLTEYQNAPPVDDEHSNQLTEGLIATKTTGLPVTVVPKETKELVITVDVGQYRIYWQATAWLDNGTGLVVDYDFKDVIGAAPNAQKQQTDNCIAQALRELRETLLEEKYFDEQGELRTVQLVMVDSGDFTDVVYDFVTAAGPMFIASKGTGETYRVTQTTDKAIGIHYYVSWIQRPNAKPIPLYHLDTNYWKRQCHDGWQIPLRNEDKSFRAGALGIYEHKVRPELLKYARQIVAEQYEEIVVPGQGVRWKWHRGGKGRGQDNHWFDTCYMGYAAREIVKAKLQAARRRAASPVIPQTESMFPGLSAVSFNPAGY